MTEQLLHYVWKHQLFNTSELKTVDGEKILILKNGIHNHQSGPDFSNAKIKIGEIIFAGSVEIHQSSSDFEKHQHQNDAAYKNVILHVVYEHDKNISQQIPTLELKGIIPLYIIRNYENLIKRENKIACAGSIQNTSTLLWEQVFNRMALNRLERKVEFVEATLKQNNQNWEETFYQLLAKNFGMKVNGEAFFELAKSIPINVLAKQKYSLLQLEALLLGQSGLLNEIFSDAYAVQLQKEYQFLQHKFSLQPIPANYWKMARMRPQNFPPLRIAQLAALIFQSSHLLSKVLECSAINDLKQLFQVQPSDYWQQHFKLDTDSIKSKKQIGDSTIENFIINTIVPIVFAYGKIRHEDDFQDKAVQWLNDLSAEKNNIITAWKNYNIKPQNAFQSQALIELKNEFCEKKNCLGCLIGQTLIKQSI